MCVCVCECLGVCVLLNVHLICLSTVQDHQKYSIAKNTWFIAMFQHQKCLAVPDVVSSILEAYFKMLFLSSLICTFFAQDFSRFACLICLKFFILLSHCGNVTGYQWKGLASKNKCIIEHNYGVYGGMCS